MKNLFELENVEEIYERMDDLSVASKRKWGIMNVDQMLAHCSAIMEVANGKAFPPRTLIGRLVSWTSKARFLSTKPFPHNAPTDKSFIIADRRDFLKEKARLKDEIDLFFKGGAEQVTKHPHPFYGYLTPMEWSIGMYKHADHHLRQFDV